MPNPSELINHWRYLAIFVVILAGNLGIPLPEEAILMLAGYLVWKGELWLPTVLAVGIVSAVIGDNLGYWVGRSYGRRMVERCGHWLLITSERFNSAQRFLARYGTIGVFIARFLPGLRFMAGPLAGLVRLPFGSFLTANLLGAVIYVPLVVAIGYGLGDFLEPFEQVVGRVEHIVLITIAVCMLIILGWRALRAQRYF